MDSDGASDYAEVMAATPVDINEYGNSYAFVIDMPGLQTADISVQVKANNVLLIRSERRRVEEEGAKNIRMERRLGKFMRKFALPENANTDKITAVCRDGVLTVTVEKLLLPKPKRSKTIESSSLEEFRVFFNLNRSHTHHIDEWVRFSLSRKLESLYLHFTSKGDDSSRKYDDCYTLNLPPSDKFNFSFMKRVSTYYVNVSGESVEMLLRNCPLLEQVSVAQSGDLLGLEIIKSFPSFKSLEITLCWNLSSVVIRDSDIVSVKYSGKAVNFVLVNVPLLTEVWVGGMCTESAEDVVGMFSSVIAQLHMFKIRFMWRKHKEFCAELRSAVEMSNLKQLVVDIGGFDNDESLLPLIDLVRASPRLQRFVIEEPYSKNRGGNLAREIPVAHPRAISTSAYRNIRRAYPELKEVEFVGYRGVSNQFKILRHLVENGIALETVVVDPWGFKEGHDITWDKIRRREFNDKVFARVNALKECVPFGINVKIISYPPLVSDLHNI
ncbi:17.6 kDa class II heat shock protein [Perilla frutescens var. frutescens]|nr:17.6 kDa class II heat shock protein [Perilla frutescens var. frutescens]